MNRQPRTLPLCLLSATAISLAPIGGPGQLSAQAAPEAGALVSVSLMSSDDQVVIVLVGDRPLSGEVQEVTTAPSRVFVDFVNVVPRVDAVTPVNQGGVTQVRVALNQADPPVTRVVLDLTRRLVYRVEEDPDAREFRIIVGTAASVTTRRSNAPVEPTAPANPDVTSSVESEAYLRWFERLAQDVDRLLSNQATTAPEDGEPLTADGVEWQRLQAELEQITPPASLQVAHDLLETAIRLGRYGAPERLADTPPEHDLPAVPSAAVSDIRAADDGMTTDGVSFGGRFNVGGGFQNIENTSTVVSPNRDGFRRDGEIDTNEWGGNFFLEYFPLRWVGAGYGYQSAGSTTANELFISDQNPAFAADIARFFDPSVSNLYGAVQFSFGRVRPFVHIGGAYFVADSGNTQRLMLNDAELTDTTLRQTNSGWAPYLSVGADVFGNPWLGVRMDYTYEQLKDTDVGESDQEVDERLSKFGINAVLSF